MSRRASRSKSPSPEVRFEELRERIRTISTSDVLTSAVARILTKAPQLEEFVMDACRFTTYPLKGCVTKEVLLHSGRLKPDVRLYLILVSEQLLTKSEKLLEWNLAKQIASACLRIFNLERSRRKLRTAAEDLATSWGFTPVG